MTVPSNSENPAMSTGFATPPLSSRETRTALRVRTLSPGRDPADWLGGVRRDEYAWFLDSAMDESLEARHSFAGADPYLVARVYGDRVVLDCRRPVRPGWASGRSVWQGPPLELLRSLLPQIPSREEFAGCPFVGGAVGYFGYEFGSQLDEIELHGDDDLGLPDCAFLFVDRVVALDRVSGTGLAFGLGFGRTRAEAVRQAEERAREGEAWLDRSPAIPPSPVPQAVEPRVTGEVSLPKGLRGDFDEETYAKTVSRVLDEIIAGNVYQADLTHRMDRAWGEDPWEFYRRLRSVNPAPFGAFVELPEVAILSSSPERFLRATANGRIESSPIKGTRRRGGSEAEDARLAKELVASEKDRAENLMIVDLVRNDLGRVCEAGTIEVSSLMRLEIFATVFQLVSTVRGRLRPECDALDAVAAAFPPGSMTGAPKIAAMRLLDALETVRRGIYSGALGYLDVRGGLDLSVVIRTILVCEGRAYFHVGGGVVVDSDPVAEYRETLDKARALFRAMAAGDVSNSVS